MKKPAMYLPAVVTVLLLLTHNAMADFNPVPDGGSTSVLAVLAIAGLAAIRRMLK